MYLRNHDIYFRHTSFIEFKKTFIRGSSVASTTMTTTRKLKQRMEKRKRAIFFKMKANLCFFSIANDKPISPFCCLYQCVNNFCFRVSFYFSDDETWRQSTFYYYYYCYKYCEWFRRVLPFLEPNKSGCI